MLLNLLLPELCATYATPSVLEWDIARTALLASQKRPNLEEIPLWGAVSCMATSYLFSTRGTTGRIRFPKEESCVIKNPNDWEWAPCKADLWTEVFGVSANKEFTGVPPKGIVPGGVVAKGKIGAGILFKLGTAPCFNSNCFFSWISCRILRLSNSES